MSVHINDLWPRLSEKTEYDSAPHPLRGSGRIRPYGVMKFVGDGALDVPFLNK